MSRLRNASLYSGESRNPCRRAAFWGACEAYQVYPSARGLAGSRRLAPLFRRSTILTVHRDVSSLVYALRNGPAPEKEHHLPAFRFNKSFLHSAGRKGIPEPAERRHTRAGTRNT